MTQTIHIAILMIPGAAQSATYGLIDLFQTANHICQESSPEPKALFEVSRWLINDGKVIPEKKGAAKDPNIVIVPPVLEGQEYMEPPTDVSTWLLKRHKEGAVTCSACAGAFMLADAGLLDGRQATTHWRLADAFKQKFPDIELNIDSILIADPDVVTAGGVMSWIDLGLHLVGRYMPPHIVMELGRFLLVDTGTRYQSYYRSFLPPVDHGDKAILKVQQQIHRDYQQPISVAEMAHLANLGERTFLRRFQKVTGYRPAQYLQQQRLQKARELLETGTLQVEQIAWQVGYEDVSAFRKMFHKQTGLSPREYRQRFSGGSKM
ncbi:GlxA family transcriptional regulator [Microbulbifer sp. TRSA001]|uniref:GlxA family transcriptional regulator n=1 Tax=Microbulbifer sp. TRSA001 TaxID=3243381 RepID=UPI00403A56DB